MSDAPGQQIGALGWQGLRVPVALAGFHLQASFFLECRPSALCMDRAACPLSPAGCLLGAVRVVGGGWWAVGRGEALESEAWAEFQPWSAGCGAVGALFNLLVKKWE